MKKAGYKSLDKDLGVNRREFIGLAAATGLLLGAPWVWAKEQTGRKVPAKPKTNIDEAMKAKKIKWSIPGPFPGKVVRVKDERAMKDGKVNGKVVDAMFRRGLTGLTGKNPGEAFPLFFEKTDVVGIKVNPVGAGLISTRLEVVDGVVRWLEENGIPRKQIVIWDRFDYMLKDAGFTEKRFAGVRIEGLQTMDEAAAEGKRDNSRWLTPKGHHVSEENFDKNIFYFADVDGPKTKPYLNQHVFNGKYSYFGKLLTKELTKIINIPVFKNTGNGISMATKNLGYGSICNTGRLHKPLFFNVCTEVLAFPCIRNKLVLNITDGLRGQFDGGPMPVAKFVREYNTLHMSTDPFAVDAVCHRELVAERKKQGVRVNEHPVYTEYLRYAQKLGLGITKKESIQYVQI
ncbi:MAG: DUF362 domain-containing protein [Acidobacteria bacterium]|nr:DUF362 domain-containing protein [Acidobacteriota bacterium]